MAEPEAEELIEKVKRLAAESIDESQPYNWFDLLYQQAGKDTSKIPWAKLKPHPELAAWLSSQAPVSSDKSAIVVGCGLGDDAEAVQAFGYRVTAFDVSSTAIAWCQERFPDSQVNYQVADLLKLPENWISAFDLVYECRNIQALPPNAQHESGKSLRSQAISTVTSLVKNGGKLLLITRIRPDESFSEGPPWGLSPSELAEFSESGLEQIGDRAFCDEKQIAHIVRLFAKN